MQLSGKTALITGSAKRVGRAIALELARAGCDVGVHYHRSAEEADELATQLREMGRRSLAVRGDLSDPQSWPALIDRTTAHFGQLDVLVNNASMFLTDQADTIGAFDYELWDRMIRVNLVAPAALSHHAHKHLAAHGDGCIVNLCDAAVDRPWPSHLSYAVSKGGLATLTKGLARAMAPTVRVVGVAPGIAVFPEEYTQELRDKLIGKVPLRREGSPEEVARLIRFLVESADYVTGEIIHIDGGRSVV